MQAVRKKLLRKTKAELVDHVVELQRELDDAWLNSDDAARQSRTDLAPLQQEKQTESRTATYSREVDEHSGTEERLRENDSRFREFAETASDWLWEADSEGRFKYLTNTFYEVSGLRPEDIVGKTRREILEKYYENVSGVGGDSRNHLLDAFDRREAYRGLLIGFRRPDGSKLYFTTNGRPVFDDGGAFQGYRGTAVNVTEQKRIKLALRESEERFRDLAESGADWFWETDADLRFTYVSPNIERILGGSAAWYQGKTRDELLGDDDRPDGWEEHLATMAARKPYRDFVYRHVTENGEISWSRNSGVPMFDTDGGFKGYRGTGSDITAIVEAEAALRANEFRSREILENSPMGVAVVSHTQEGDRIVAKRLFSNDTLAEMFGFPTSDELVNTDIADSWVDQKELQLVNASMETGDDLIDFEARRRRVDGTEWWVSMNTRPIHFDGRDCTMVWHFDITERKRAEAALAESETRFRALFDSLPLSVHIKDTESRSVLANAAYNKFFGLSSGEIAGKSPHELFGDELADRFMATDKQVLADGQSFEREYELTNADGELRNVTTTKFPILGADGSPSLVGNINTDITERKRAEAALQRSEAQLVDAIESIPEGFILYDADERFVICNSKYRDFYPQGNDVFVPGNKLEDIARIVFQRGAVVGAVENLDEWMDLRMAQYRAAEGTHEQQLADGRWLLCSERRLSGGGTVSIRTDITAMKRAEQSLRESEQQLRLVIDSLPAFIAYIDADERYRLVNRLGAEWFAASEEELIGMSVAEIHGENYTTFRPPMLEVLARKEVSFESEILYRDGIRRDIEAVNVPNVDADGEVLGYFAMGLDVTERKEAERRLRDSEERFRAVVDNSPAAIVLKDIEGRFLIGNKTLREWLNVEADAEFLGKTTHDFLPKDIADRIAGHDRLIATRGEPVIQEREALYPDGVTRKVWTHKFPIFGSDGECTAIGTVNIDVTEQRDLEAKLVQSQKMETVGQLTGGIAHDFNNLLAAVLTNIELLAERVADDAKVQTLALNAKEAVLRGSDLTDRLLTFSRHQSLKTVPIDLNGTVRSMYDLLARTLGGKIEIRIVEGRDLQSCLTDPSQIENAILNLAINARDAMPGGGILTLETANLSLDAARSTEFAPGNYTMLSVSDSGGGMAPEVITRVFEPFFTTKETGQGTGLGLSMVYGFVSQSGGHVEIESEVGRGTTVRIFLPIAVGGEAGTKVDPAAVAAGEMRGGERILVVDDNEMVRVAVAAMLEDLGYRVLEAPDGPIALAVLAGAEDIDLLFTDVEMPAGMSGPDLAEKASDRHPELKLLFTSGHTEKQLGQGDDPAENVAVLTKPYRKTELALAVRKALDN